MTVSQLRQHAREIWEAALHAANPSTSLHNAIQVSDGVLSVAGRLLPLEGRLIVVGAGKAAARMAQVVEEIAGSQISSGLVVTKYGHGLELNRIRLVEAGHPIPDESGVRAVRETQALLSGLTPKDVVLSLISGGGSALWPSPAEGITLEEKQQVTQMLLRAGATIQELNGVRKHLSGIKGGQLARWAAPARVISLIMSDVIGDPLDFIASGPTAPDTTSFDDALSTIRKYGVQPAPSILQRLEAGVRGQIPENPKPGDPVFRNVDNRIIANNRLLVDSASKKAKELGFNTLILGTELEGEAKNVARFLSVIGREVSRSGNPVRPPACILAAGETTVTVRGNGLGGRNQEMAVAWAIEAAAHPEQVATCFASVATDGTDGPTDAAGGLVDPLTFSRAIDQRMDAKKFLQDNDSYHLLTATGDLIVTGPTQTNLMDIQILLVG
jgi:hydroxypyruvate reductase